MIPLKFLYLFVEEQYHLPANDKLRFDVQHDACLASMVTSLSRILNSNEGRELLSKQELKDTEITFETYYDFGYCTPGTFNCNHEKSSKGFEALFTESSLADALRGHEGISPSDTPEKLKRDLSVAHSINIPIQNETFKEDGFWSNGFYNMSSYSGFEFAKDLKQRLFCVYSKDEVLKGLQGVVKAAPKTK